MRIRSLTPSVQRADAAYHNMLAARDDVVIAKKVLAVAGTGDDAKRAKEALDDARAADRLYSRIAEAIMGSE